MKYQSLKQIIFFIIFLLPINASAGPISRTIVSKENAEIIISIDNNEAGTTDETQKPAVDGNFSAIGDCNLNISPSVVKSGGLLPRFRIITITGTNTNFNKTSQITIEGIIRIFPLSIINNKIKVFIVVPSKSRLNTGTKEITVMTGDEVCKGNITILRTDSTTSVPSTTTVQPATTTTIIPTTSTTTLITTSTTSTLISTTTTSTNKLNVFLCGDSITTELLYAIKDEKFMQVNFLPNNSDIYTFFSGARLAEWNTPKSGNCDADEHYQCLKNATNSTPLDFIVVMFYGNNFYELQTSDKNAYENSEGKGDVNLYTKSYLSFIDQLLSDFPNAGIIFVSYYPWTVDGQHYGGYVNDIYNPAETNLFPDGFGSDFYGGHHPCIQATASNCFDCSQHMNQNVYYFLQTIKPQLESRSIQVIDIFSEIVSSCSDTDEFLFTISYDGIHPNISITEWWDDLLKPRLFKAMGLH
jgi:hypothetical protein